MRMLPLAVLSIGAVLATNAVAQPAPPPPAPAATSAAPPAPDDAAAPPPPPPPGPRAERRPPPPPVPGIVVDRGPGGTFHVDLRCSPQDPIRECAAIATQMIDKLNGAVQPK